jgi:hypothetical protein
MDRSIVAAQSSSRRLTRRAALAGFPAALAALAATSRGAEARRAWCRADPIVVIDGAIVDIFVSAPLGELVTALLTVTGPNQIVVTVPNGVNAWLLLSDLGFGRGNTVSFAQSADLQKTDDGVQVRVDVYVPAKGSFPVRVDFAPRLLGILSPESTEGVTNSWFGLTTNL